MEMTDRPDRDPIPEQAKEDEFLEERRTLYNVYPSQAGGLPPQTYLAGKRKWIAGLLSFLVPGIGHFYLGLMSRGLLFMLLFFLDIAGIVYFGVQGAARNIPLIVLGSLMIPVIYFYNIFDAIHSTDKVNRAPVDRIPAPRQPTDTDPSAQTAQREAVHPDERGPQAPISKGRMPGLLLAAFGAILLLMVKKPDLLQYWNQDAGTYVGAAILIGAGLILFLRDRRR